MVAMPEALDAGAHDARQGFFGRPLEVAVARSLLLISLLLRRGTRRRRRWGPDPQRVGLEQELRFLIEVRAVDPARDIGDHYIGVLPRAAEVFEIGEWALLVFGNVQDRPLPFVTELRPEAPTGDAGHDEAVAEEHPALAFGRRRGRRLFVES